MANDIDMKDAYKSELAGSAESSGGETEKRESKRTDAPAEAQTEPAAAVFLERRTDHTPPPIVIESGSLTIETDEDLTTRDNTGGQGHPRRHRVRANRSIKGLRVLKTTGKTIYEDDEAAGTEIKIWWDRHATDPQIFIGAGKLDINADFDLGAGTTISRPPVTPNVRRVKRYTHPSAGSHGIERFEIVKSAQTIALDDVWVVMIWDTGHDD